MQKPVLYNPAKSLQGMFMKLPRALNCAENRNKQLYNLRIW